MSKSWYFLIFIVDLSLQINTFWRNKREIFVCIFILISILGICFANSLCALWLNALCTRGTSSMPLNRWIFNKLYRKIFYWINFNSLWILRYSIEFHETSTNVWYFHYKDLIFYRDELIIGYRCREFWKYLAKKRRNIHKIAINRWEIRFVVVIDRCVEWERLIELEILRNSWILAFSMDFWVDFKVFIVR